MIDLFMSVLDIFTWSNLWWLLQKVIILWLMFCVIVLGLIVLNIINYSLWKAVKRIKAKKSLYRKFSGG